MDVEFSHNDQNYNVDDYDSMVVNPDSANDLVTILSNIYDNLRRQCISAIFYKATPHDFPHRSGLRKYSSSNYCLQCFAYQNFEDRLIEKIIEENNTSGLDRIYDWLEYTDTHHLWRRDLLFALEHANIETVQHIMKWMNYDLYDAAERELSYEEMIVAAKKNVSNPDVAELIQYVFDDGKRELYLGFDEDYILCRLPHVGPNDKDCQYRLALASAFKTWNSLHKKRYRHE